MPPFAQRARVRALRRRPRVVPIPLSIAFADHAAVVSATPALHFRLRRRSGRSTLITVTSLPLVLIAVVVLNVLGPSDRPHAVGSSNTLPAPSSSAAGGSIAPGFPAALRLPSVEDQVTPRLASVLAADLEQAGNAVYQAQTLVIAADNTPQPAERAGPTLNDLQQAEVRLAMAQLAVQQLQQPQSDAAIAQARQAVADAQAAIAATPLLVDQSSATGMATPPPGEEIAESPETWDTELAALQESETQAMSVLALAQHPYSDAQIAAAQTELITAQQALTAAKSAAQPNVQVPVPIHTPAVQAPVTIRTPTVAPIALPSATALATATVAPIPLARPAVTPTPAVTASAGILQSVTVQAKPPATSATGMPEPDGTISRRGTDLGASGIVIQDRVPFGLGTASPEPGAKTPEPAAGAPPLPLAAASVVPVSTAAPVAVATETSAAPPHPVIAPTATASSGEWEGIRAGVSPDLAALHEHVDRAQATWDMYAAPADATTVQRAQDDLAAVQRRLDAFRQGDRRSLALAVPPAAAPESVPAVLTPQDPPESLAAAQNRYQEATQWLNALTAGPDPEALRAAQAELQAAQHDYETLVAQADSSVTGGLDPDPQRALVKYAGVTKPVASRPDLRGFIWPAHGPITSFFGPRHPLGIDIAQGLGGPVTAAAAGVVSLSRGDACCSYGYYIDIIHPSGYMTRYGHLLRPPFLLPGAQVAQGQIIGLSGSTGFSTGPHVHFEIRLYGVPVDPLKLIVGSLELPSLP